MLYIYTLPLLPDENGKFISLNAAASTFSSAHLSGIYDDDDDVYLKR
jgi:hypothetical protein